MIVMALDHTRDFFTNATVDPTDPLHSWPALFATRWITHICAPGFVALAGVSAYLQLQRGKSQRELRTFLWTRGLWLALFDFVGWGFLISFSLPPAFTVGPLWVSGFSMIALSLLLPLPPRVIGVIGAAILLLHNLLDPIRLSGTAPVTLLWNFLHQPSIFWGHGMLFIIQYPLLPWLGLMCVSYSLGPALARAPGKRQRAAVRLGLVLLAAFVLMRCFNGYGDPQRFAGEASLARTIMSFLNVQKYPPSLDFVLATGGCLLLLFAFLDHLVALNALPRVASVSEVFGRTPFFFYAIHFLLLHVSALSLSAFLGQDVRQWLAPAAFLLHGIPGWGFSLPGIYALWLAVLFLMYWPCHWFAGLRSRRRGWWLSYL